MKFVCVHLLCLLIFLVQKINWWSDNPILIISHCVFFLFVFVNMWLIREGVLGVTLVSWFYCLQLKVLQNSRYFFVSNDTLFVLFIMFLFSSPNVEPLWYKFIFRSPRIRHSSLDILSKFRLFGSISRNLLWSGGL